MSSLQQARPSSLLSRWGSAEGLGDTVFVQWTAESMVSGDSEVTHSPVVSLFPLKRRCEPEVGVLQGGGVLEGLGREVLCALKEHRFPSPNTPPSFLAHIIGCAVTPT